MRRVLEFLGRKFPQQLGPDFAHDVSGLLVGHDTGKLAFQSLTKSIESNIDRIDQLVPSHHVSIPSSRQQTSYSI